MAERGNRGSAEKPSTSSTSTQRVSAAEEAVSKKEVAIRNARFLAQLISEFEEWLVNYEKEIKEKPARRVELQQRFATTVPMGSWFQELMAVASEPTNTLVSNLANEFRGLYVRVVNQARKALDESARQQDESRAMPASTPPKSLAKCHSRLELRRELDELERMLTTVQRSSPTPERAHEDLQRRTLAVEDSYYASYLGWLFEEESPNALTDTRELRDRFFETVARARITLE